MLLQLVWVECPLAGLLALQNLLSLFLLSGLMRGELLTLRVRDWLTVEKTTIWKDPYVTPFLWRIQALCQRWIRRVHDLT